MQYYRLAKLLAWSCQVSFGSKTNPRSFTLLSLEGEVSRLRVTNSSLRVSESGNLVIISLVYIVTEMMCHTPCVKCTLPILYAKTRGQFHIHYEHYKLSLKVLVCRLTECANFLS